MYLNTERILVKMLKEIAKEESLHISLFSHDWIIRLQSGEKVKHIMGYDFDLNSSSSQLIAKDKCGAAELLEFGGVTCAEHQLFLSPDKSQYVGTKSNWEDILSYAKKHEYNLVCKANTGTGGNDVIRVKTPLDLENAVYSLFSRNLSIAMSPYYNIDNEYRIVVLNGEAQLVFCKVKPSIVGDGTTKLLQLFEEKFNKNERSILLENENGNDDISFDRVLKKGERLELGWKHNLGKGSTPEILVDGALRDQLITLALSAAKTLNIQFASIDIVEIEKELKVLEVNSGIMMESFARHSKDGYEIAKNIYKKAVKLMFS